MEAKWRLEKPQNDMDSIPTYASGTPEREELIKQFGVIRSQTEEIPLIINGKEVETGDFYEVKSPHDHQQILARAHLAGEAELKDAIDGAVAAQESWAELDGYQRAAIFNRAADILAGPRRIENLAAIMVNQSKTPFEAEIDLIELIDFWRFNAYYMQFLYDQQPGQAPGEINRFDWRPLEGFVMAISPFNFYAIGGNLPTAPAMVGNVSLWKPASSVLYSNYRIMQILIEAGLPDGVIQFVPFSSKHSDVVMTHSELAGLHFTGSYETLVHLWQKIGSNLSRYRSFPRIIGETGGKDFILVHQSAKLEMIAPNAIRGAFEYQGQKCSAASRMYVPESLWPDVKSHMLEIIPKLKVGSTEDLETSVAAIITEDAYRNITNYIDYAKENSSEYEILFGGEYDDSKGWFVTPTVIITSNPDSKLICEEIFGPVLTIFVYPDSDYENTLDLVDRATTFALTGSIFAQDRMAIEYAEKKLRFAAGNFYINDKPTGAIVGRQPFGGARHSGTNDKAGSWLNMSRWLSPRTIKETLVPPTDWPRPYQS
jgi:1-pyrroline-5-carboxylate dehydrogenase